MSDLLRVTDMETIDGYALKLTFNDGLNGVLDFSTFLTGSIFGALQDKSLFGSARLAYGTVVWDGNIDMAPEYLHEKLAQQVRVND